MQLIGSDSPSGNPGTSNSIPINNLEWFESTSKRAKGPKAGSEPDFKMKVKEKDREYEVGDSVLLKVSPWKGVMRFGKKGKLNPRFIGPFEILRRIGPLAYELALPPNLQQVHNVFHVSMLRKYHADVCHVIEYEQVDLQPDLTYIEQPIRIMDQKEQVLRNKMVKLVRILWRNQNVEEST
ncbi:hypothetical protein AgCh_021413 [Apium graveolens]